MAKSRFKTKLSKKQKRNNVLVFSTVFVCAYGFVLLFSFSIGNFDNWSDPEIYLIALAASFFVLSIMLFPVLLVAIFLGAQRGKARRVRDDSKFVPTQNIEYYREILSGLNPWLVSILVDLDIYGKKDIAATLLRMQNKKALSFSKYGRMIAIGADPQNLDEGELDLIWLINNGMFRDKKALMKWKQNRFIEAERMGYIQRKSVEIKEKSLGVHAKIGVVSAIASIVLWAVFLGRMPYGTLIYSAAGAVFIFAALLVIDALLFVPFYILVRKAYYIKRGDFLWERTPLGNEMAEKIAGLGRFISEFSRLSEANKEQIAMWEDYLLYAIVLEENEKIVKDIGKFFKVKLRRL